MNKHEARNFSKFVFEVILKNHNLDARQFAREINIPSHTSVLNILSKKSNMSFNFIQKILAHEKYKIYGEILLCYFLDIKITYTITKDSENTFVEFKSPSIS